jgi:glucoamylase
VATPATYRTGSSPEFAQIISAATSYADSFISVVQQYTPSNGALAEQFSRTKPGSPLSAHDLTWSYAAFVSTAERRAGQYPPSWIPNPPTSLPSTCSRSSVPGVYVPAIAAGAPDVTDSCAIPVTFVVNATTYFGEDLYVIGNTTDLGSWDIENAQPMTASNYTAERPVWIAEVEVQSGGTISYIYARRENCNQGYLYETTNRTLMVPSCEMHVGGAAAIITNDAWIGPVGAPGNC